MGGSDGALRKVALLLILLLSAALLSTSFVGMTRKPMDRPAEGTAATKVFWKGSSSSSSFPGMPSESFQGEEDAGIHHRNLGVRTNDYGSYDPPPAFEKPPSKPIPN